MSIDIWKRGTFNQELPLTVDNARMAVRLLDGGDTSDTELKNDNHYLTISCGPDKFWVIYGTLDAEGQPGESYSLMTDREAKGHQVRMVGGTMTDVWASELVCREAAEKAAVEFAEAGRINLTPDWLNSHDARLLVQANEGEDG